MSSVGERQCDFEDLLPGQLCSHIAATAEAGSALGPSTPWAGVWEHHCPSRGGQAQTLH